MTAKKGRPTIKLDRTALIFFVKSGATKKHIQNYFGIAKSTLYRYLKNAPITEEELNLVEIKLTRPDMEKSTIELVKRDKAEKNTIEIQDCQKNKSSAGEIKPNQGKTELAKLIEKLENTDDF